MHKHQEGGGSGQVGFFGRRHLALGIRYSWLYNSFWLKYPHPLSLHSLSGKWRVGQAVKTLPFHGRMTGSIPVRATRLGIFREILRIPIFAFRTGHYYTHTTQIRQEYRHYPDLDALKSRSIF